MGMTRITNKEKLVQALQMVPYVGGGTKWGGADCWGIAELFFLNAHNIDIKDRGDIPPGPRGMAAGYGARGKDWIPVNRVDLMDGDLLVMKALIPVFNKSEEIIGRQIIEHGHCGIFTCGGVLHSRYDSGCVFQDYDAPKVGSRVTAILRRAELYR